MTPCNVKANRSRTLRWYPPRAYQPARQGDVYYPYLTAYTVVAVPKTARKKANHQR